MIAVAAPLLLRAGPAEAIPSFAQQTGQPCAACHVGAFGPQLKPFGRDFKLYGYQSTDKKSHELPIALMLQTSITNTAANQVPPPADHFGENNNFAVDQVSLFYGGRAPLGFGVFAQATFGGIDQSFTMDNFDVRRAKEITLFGQDSVVGVDFNNNPTVQDVWNSTPAWGFPYSSSGLAPGVAAAPLVDGGLAGQVVGSGAYLMWNDTLYLEGSAYAPLERHFAGRLGEGTDGSTDRFTGVIPYWRVALLHDFGSTQTIEAGAYGLRAQRYPGGDVSSGTDTLNDWALDAVYQYIGSGKQVVSAHATYIHEDQDLAASAILSGTRPKNRVATARADVSYSYDDTWTPSVQLFQTTGTYDPALYSPGLRTSGQVYELAWAPWGKPGSPVLWGNARFAVQYVAYTQFNGDRGRAKDNNTLYLNAWIAMAPLGWRVAR